MKKWYRYLGLLLVLALAGCAETLPETEEPALSPAPQPKRVVCLHLAYGIPCPTDLRLDRQGFSIGYSQKHRQALWVSYELTAENLARPQLPRLRKFSPDPEVPDPVVSKDYNRTGYDRGHLAPAADMSYSKETLRDSFYMSNISPQKPDFNRGVWKHLESQVRDWARRENRIIVVTGPIFAAEPQQLKSGIPIPCAFYKVIYDPTPPEKMIGFILPNRGDQRSFWVFATTVDAVENATGCDFFSALPDDREKALESSVKPELWQ